MPRRRAALALFALSVGGVGIGLTEFVIAGLLTELADDLGVAISRAGNAVGVHALAVVPRALVITPLLMRRPPKHALTALLAFFIAGNLLSAWAPTYGVMLVGRAVAALAHGGYFGIGAVLAASLVPPAKRASAVAALFAGLTIANVLGVPGGLALIITVRVSARRGGASPHPTATRWWSRHCSCSRSCTRRSR